MAKLPSPNEDNDELLDDSEETESNEVPNERVIPTAVDTSGTSPIKYIWIFLAVIFGLLFVFYGILLFSLFGGYVSNPLFDLLGIDATSLKNVLIQFTSGLFGFLSLVFLFFALSNVFRYMTLPKESPKRGPILKKMVLYVTIFALIFGLFIGLYLAIASADTVKRVEQDNSLVATDPPSVIGLQAPITIDFDLEERLKAKFGGDLSSVRQVSWDFDGDGIIDANGYQVANRFMDKGENNGIFDVLAKIEFQNANGEREVFETTREVVIENVGVFAEITSNVEQGVSPLSVEFSASNSTDPDGKVILYEWDFDDDGDYEFQQTSPEIISRDFSSIGEHVVKLRVTGSQRDYSLTQKTIVVEGGRPSIEAKITSEVGFDGEAPFVLVMSGKNSFVENGVITKYEWFIEGEKDTTLGSSIRRIFRTEGEYDVTLTVENDLGERHRVTETVNIRDRAKSQDVIIVTDPPADKDDVLQGGVPFEVEFDASTSKVDGAIDWQWDFDDDGISDDFGQKVTKIYRTPGRYVVHLRITTSNGDEFEAVRRVIVGEAGLRAKITANQLSGSVPLSVEFDGSGSATDTSEIIDYVWEFPGEDPIHYGAKISYLFRNLGTFPVKLTVIDTLGQQSSSITYISVRPPALVADFSMFPEAGFAPLEIQFDASPSQGVAVEYHWDFGDGQKAQTFKPIHLYENPGTYLVQLKMINDRGIVSKIQKRVTVKRR